ncbi:MAG: ABC transporter permease [Geothrix sp.]|uniref:ABC transporter permease n=1 Tax=Geothrix sp. TaxID=1962974 RepID=UPI001810B982|nr:FtsX-like permease family protein [Geothrix sp.]NWJ40702.1 ABC transporter permease [Geothrix sp.]WIL21291.1 MAG: ABC transporter permease [Geothrix sp.]
MILARLALRNLLRQRRRTALTLMVIVAGFLALSLAGGFMAQTFQGLSDAAIRGGLGHLQVMPPGAMEGDEAQSLEQSLSDGEGLAARLRQDPAVAEVLPRIQFMGLLASGAKSVAFLGTAVDPVLEPRHMACTEALNNGAKTPAGAGSRWLSADPAVREVILGVGLARTLGATVGSSLTLMSTTRGGALNAVDVEVAGLQDLGLRELNDRFLTVSLATADQLLESAQARSRLSVVLKRPQDIARAQARVQAQLPGTVVKPWFELASFYRQVKLLYFAIFGFMGLVLFLVVLLATANTLLMSVMERVREFGVLRAMGLQPGQLLALLQWEGAFLGLMGSALGLVATLLLRAGLNALHIEMPAPPGTSHGYELDIHFVPAVYAIVALGLQATIQVSALFPGLKAARLRIVEALRHV